MLAKDFKEFVELLIKHKVEYILYMYHFGESKKYIHLRKNRHGKNN